MPRSVVLDSDVDETSSENETCYRHTGSSHGTSSPLSSLAEQRIASYSALDPILPPFPDLIAITDLSSGEYSVEGQISRSRAPSLPLSSSSDNLHHLQQHQGGLSDRRQEQGPGRVRKDVFPYAAVSLLRAISKQQEMENYYHLRNRDRKPSPSATARVCQIMLQLALLIAILAFLIDLWFRWIAPRAAPKDHYSIDATSKWMAGCI